jgi:hypothetical protein
MFKLGATISLPGTCLYYLMTYPNSSKIKQQLVGTGYFVVEYYSNIKHCSTGKLWAGKVIAALWNYSWTIWDHQNDHLHNLDVKDELLDMASIHNAIKPEWSRGIAGLNVMDQLQFCGLTLRKLLKSK